MVKGAREASAWVAGRKWVSEELGPQVGPFPLDMIFIFLQLLNGRKD